MRSSLIPGLTVLSDGRAAEGEGKYGVSDSVDDGMGAIGPTGVAATGEVNCGQER